MRHPMKDQAEHYADLLEVLEDSNQAFLSANAALWKTVHRYRAELERVQDLLGEEDSDIIEQVLNPRDSQGEQQ